MDVILNPLEARFLTAFRSEYGEVHIYTTRCPLTGELKLLVRGVGRYGEPIAFEYALHLVNDDRVTIDAEHFADELGRMLAEGLREQERIATAPLGNPAVP